MTEADERAEFSGGAGDRRLPAAMSDLYRDHLDYVWNGLRRMGIRISDLEDLTQEVFLRAFRDWHRYDPNRPLRPWLFRIAYHVAVDFLRLERHFREVGGELPEVESHERRPDEAAATSQSQRQLFALLQSLDVDRRAVVVMHELFGHSMPEIAEALSIPLNTAYSRLRLARAELGKLAKERLPDAGEA